MPRRAEPSPYVPDSRKPWDRRKGESQQAYAALRTYLDMGESRNLIALAYKLNKSRQLMSVWSARHDWVDRAVAYDGHLAAVELARREQVRLEHAEKAERSRIASAHANVDVGAKLFLKAQQMLESPLYEETIEEAYEDGRPKTIVMKPASWSLKDAAAFAKVASDLLQIGIFQLSFAADDFDPTKASPEELRAYLEARGVKALPGTEGA